ncbi:unnamed protein product [Brassica oleracea var. botrytis]|uniref:Uncharacterized protein n=1 Tax=Brassica oleracea TaxID=3712 RepID=A0A3P6F652_BRAOL|nr:unnamed protein product [Brassica oleracea]
MELYVLHLVSKGHASFWWHGHFSRMRRGIAVKSVSGQTTVGIDPQRESMRTSWVLNKRDFSVKQGPVPGDSESKSGLPNPNASPFKSFSEIKAGLSNTGGKSFNTFSEDMRSGLTPNAPPTVKNPMRSRFPNTNLPDQLNLPSTAGSGSSAPSYQSFTQSIERPGLYSKGNVKIKCKATSGSLPDLKGGRKMTSYTADATAENIGRRVKAMGLKSVVVKVNGFTHFKKKRNAIVAFRSGYSSSRNDQNPIVYIEDTTRKAHNGCRLPRKRRSQQQPLLPDPSHNLKVNPFGLLSSSIHGNPLALYGLESDPPLLLNLSTISRRLVMVDMDYDLPTLLSSLVLYLVYDYLGREAMCF